MDDPEDVLRSLMDTGALPEYKVQIAEAEGSAEFPKGAAAPTEPTPSFRIFDWSGNVPDGDAAVEAALDAFSKRYGDRPTNYRADIRRLSPPA
jgi:hypothetical protein